MRIHDMSFRDNTRLSHAQPLLPGRFMRSLFGLCVLPLALGCSSDKHNDGANAVAGASGSAPISNGAGGSTAGAPSQSGSAGAVVQAGSANAGSANAGSANGGAPTGLAGAGGSAGASAGAANGGGAGATIPATNPFADLVPSA